MNNQLPEPITVTYAVSVTITRRAIDDCGDSSSAEVAEYMKTNKARLELEREVIKALRGFDGCCDVEVIDAK